MRLGQKILSRNHFNALWKPSPGLLRNPGLLRKGGACGMVRNEYYSLCQQVDYALMSNVPLTFDATFSAVLVAFFGRHSQLTDLLGESVETGGESVELRLETFHFGLETFNFGVHGGYTIETGSQNRT
jgi:hypothetical protein